jgi:type IV pilus assembly protein PilV
MTFVCDGRRARRHSRSGFTLIEAMIAMLILAVGVLGIASMQTATTGATKAGQDFSHAQGLAERMIELLRTDGLRWTSSGALSTATRFLSAALPATQGAGAQSAWTTIPNNAIVATLGGSKVDRNFAPDTQGSPDWAIGFRYCVYYRTAWVSPPNALRADVRIAWARDSGDNTKLQDCTADVANVADFVNVRSVNVSTMIMMNFL